MKIYDSIREALPVEGKRVAMVTCEDWAEVQQRPLDENGERPSLIFLHFEDATTLSFTVSDTRGFDYDGLPASQGS